MTKAEDAQCALLGKELADLMRSRPADWQARWDRIHAKLKWFGFNMEQVLVFLAITHSAVMGDAESDVQALETERIAP